MKLKRIALNALLLTLLGTAVFAAQPAGNSNGSTAVGNGSAAAAYINASASPGQYVCVGPTSGPNTQLVASPCTSLAGTVTSVTASSPVTSSGGSTPNIACATCVTGLTAGLNILVGTGTTPSVATTGAPTFANITDSTLTSGLCVQAGTGGILTSAAAACGSGGGGGTITAAVAPSLPNNTPSPPGQPYIFSNPSPAPSSTPQVATYEGWYTTFINSTELTSSAFSVYPMNETSGSVATDIVSGENGTYHGADVQGVPGLTADITNSQRNGDASGSIDVMTTPNSDIELPPYSAFPGDFSAELLVRVRTVCPTAQCGILDNSAGIGSTSGFAVYEDGSGLLYLVAQGATNITTPGFATTNGNVYHIAVTYVAATNLWTFYVNGNVVGLITNAYTAGASNFQIGHRIGVAQGANANDFQSLAFYSRALTPLEVEGHAGSVQQWLALSTLTSVSAFWPLAANQSQTGSSISCSTCAVYNAAGNKVTAAYHTVSDVTTCTLDGTGTCGATVNFVGSAQFTSATSYSCDDSLTSGGMTTPLTYILVTPVSNTQVVFAVANGSPGGTANISFSCRGT